jgi:hypothetical protein
MTKRIKTFQIKVHLVGGEVLTSSDFTRTDFYETVKEANQGEPEEVIQEATDLVIGEYMYLALQVGKLTYLNFPVIKDNDLQSDRVFGFNKDQIQYSEIIVKYE